MRIAIAVTVSGLALAALSACGGSSPPAASPHTATAPASAGTSRIHVACFDLVGLKMYQGGHVPAGYVRNIVSAAAGTTIAADTREWAKDYRTSAADIKRMSSDQAMNLELSLTKVTAALHAACLAHGVPGVMDGR